MFEETGDESFLDEVAIHHPEAFALLVQDSPAEDARSADPSAELAVDVASVFHHQAFVESKLGMEGALADDATPKSLNEEHLEMPRKLIGRFEETGDDSFLVEVTSLYPEAFDLLAQSGRVEEAASSGSSLDTAMKATPLRENRLEASQAVRSIHKLYYVSILTPLRRALPKRISPF